MLMPPLMPLSTGILGIMYFGDVVFAVSGALTAARHRMDVMGFILIGTITGIGGGPPGTCCWAAGSGGPRTRWSWSFA